MTQTNLLRPVAPIRAPDISPAVLGGKPELTWLPLSALVINDEYQRHISEKSIYLIRRMIGNFDWGRVKALSVVEVEGGLFEVIDGQHTAIAAASHGGIEALPCLVTRGKDVTERAADFVSLNRDRLSMTPMQVFFAELAAGDEIVTDVMQGMASAGARILKQPPPFGRYQVGDAVCIAALKRLAAEGGPAYVKRVASICVAAKVAPIKAATVKAIQRLIWGDGPKIPDQAIIDVLRTYGQDELIHEAITKSKSRDGLNSTKALCEIMRSRNV